MIKINNTQQFILACVLLVFGMSMLIAGFIVPPLGVIDNSLLVAWGETLTFIGAIVGIDYSYKSKNK